MAKSLQEIEAAFKEQYQQGNLQIKNEQRENSRRDEQQGDTQKDDTQKAKKISLISDVIFCLALVGVGASALFLSWGEKNGYQGGIGILFDEYREMILIGFFVFIIISFFLRFLGNKENV